MRKDVEMIKGFMEYECITKTPYRESTLINHTLYIPAIPNEKSNATNARFVVEARSLLRLRQGCYTTENLKAYRFAEKVVGKFTKTKSKEQAKNGKETDNPCEGKWKTRPVCKL